MLRGILLFIYSNRKYKNLLLLLPVTFFVMELVVALYINWMLFGESYNYEALSNGLENVQMHNPLIIIKYLHSARLTHPFGSFSDTPFVYLLHGQSSLIKAICLAISLVFAYVGIFMSIVWIKKFIADKKNDIIWWMWPAACLGAHVVIFFLTESYFNNVFLKQF